MSVLFIEQCIQNCNKSVSIYCSNVISNLQCLALYFDMTTSESDSYTYAVIEFFKTILNVESTLVSVRLGCETDKNYSS